jgi:betaine-aldehyde dehydrogenase
MLANATRRRAIQLLQQLTADPRSRVTAMALGAAAEIHSAVNRWSAFAGEPQKAEEEIPLGRIARHRSLDERPDALGVPTRLFIDGKWMRPERGRMLKIVDPATEKVLTRSPAASAGDVNLAVKAARRAFDSGIWSKKAGAERALVLRAIAQGLRDQKEDLARIESRNNGKPLANARQDISDSADCFDYYAKLAEKLDKDQNAPYDVENPSFECTLKKQPIGVVAGIVPWNYPLLMAVWKVAPALAAGCAMVLKPSELTPLSALKLGEIAQKAGLPPGVLNVVPGLGPEAGEALKNSDKIDAIAFTGGTKTGRSIAEAAGRSLIPVHPELGGKSPVVVHADADLDQAAHWVAMGIFNDQGQVCSANSRAIVDEKVAPEFEKKLVAIVNALKIGDGMEDGVHIGPLVSRGQYEKVLGYIESAKAEGAKLLVGGGRAPGFKKGYFVSPTIFTNVTPDMKIFREEIFGPVLAITTFKTEKQAIRLANDSQYGLTAAVFSKDKAKLDRFADAVDAGVVWKNASQIVGAPGPAWGGVKKSGYGRELGPWGLDNYLVLKSVMNYVGDPYTYVEPKE